MTTLILVSLFLVIVFVLAVTIALAGIRLRRDQSDDAVLVIKPPRPYVDADGRSDFRPELREKVVAYRAKKEGR